MTRGRKDETIEAGSGGEREKKCRMMWRWQKASKKEWVICSALYLAYRVSVYMSVRDLEDWNIDVEQWDRSEK